MKRNVDLKDISDGKLYTENDMAKVGCNDCAGCSACCQGMGESIVLDPFDMYRLTCMAGMSLEQLFSYHVELHVVDGITLPNLRMGQAADGATQSSEREERCTFLNEAGRCSIHAHRPGICRLFPLGRVYEDGDFKYFLQVGECKSPVHTKVKVGKWIAVENPSENRKFLNTWHYLLNDLEEMLAGMEDLELAKKLNMLLLNTFYLTPYDPQQDFYPQFQERVNTLKKYI